MNKLSPLQENQTKIFFSPMEGNDTLVRTGVLTYITSLLHCLLHATSKDYVEMEEDERKNMATTLYSHISDKILNENWKNNKGDISSKLLFIKNTIAALKKFKEKNKKEELYELLFQLVSISFIENILEKSKEYDISEIISTVNTEVKNLLESSLKKLDEKKRRIYIEKFLEMLRKIFDDAEEESSIEKKSYTNFVLNQKNVSILADKFHRNIYFLDAENRLPYKVNDLEEMPERKSIIVLKIKDKYEVVGRLLAGNKIQREFQSTDELIKRINTFLYFPQEIPKKYPFLAIHLPKKVEKNIEVKPAVKNSTLSVNSIIKTPIKMHKKSRRKSHRRSHRKSHRRDSSSSPSSHSTKSTQSTESTE